VAALSEGIFTHSITSENEILDAKNVSMPLVQAAM